VGLISAAENAFMGLQQSVYVRTDGRLGHRMIGVPTMLLRTKGRRTGQIRTAALVYARDGEELVLVASNHGYDRPPGWYFNIEADPRVEAQVGRSRWSGTARVVGPEDPDYPRLWRLVNDNNHHRYEAYQTKTSRPISLIVVKPA
jgi:deazaflavin-dependent oxidoreductase (nitroreductase family)